MTTEQCIEALIGRTGRRTQPALPSGRTSAGEGTSVGLRPVRRHRLLAPSGCPGCRRRRKGYAARPLSAQERQVLTVPESLAGVLLQDFLASSYPSVDRAVLRQLEGRGLVVVNGMPPRRNGRLSAFDYIELRVDRSELEPHRRQQQDRAPGELAVLFETAHALVIDKPQNEVTVPDRTGEQKGIHGLLPLLRPNDDLRIVHRLDRDTSCCLIVAKGAGAARHFDRVFREHLVHKRYVALVHGVVSRAEQTIESFLGPDPRRLGKVLSSATESVNFKHAKTIARVREAFAQHTLLELSPETGRTHQIRVHLMSIGHPIVGDEDYGGAPLLLSQLKRVYKLRTGLQERPLLSRMFLHSERIAFPDVDGAQIEVEAPLPADLQRALSKLANFGAVRMRRQ